jgi:hypothetical protein
VTRYDRKRRGRRRTAQKLPSVDLSGFHCSILPNLPQT